MLRMIKRLKTKMKLNQAYRDADVPCWTVSYETLAGEGQVSVYANSAKQAKRNADEIIRIANGNKPYAIKGISCV